MLGLVLLLPCCLLFVAADSAAISETSDSFTYQNSSESATASDPSDDYKEKFSHCGVLQKLFGMSFDKMQGDKAPNLDNLTLVFRTKYSTKVFNINTAAESLWKEKEFDEDKRLIIFVHGYTDNPTKEAFTKISQAFLANGHAQLIALDASSLINWLYLRCTAYVRFIGTKLGQVLATIVQQGLDPSQIHIIGHSLGAHIAGFCGKTLQELTGKRPGRISGLDPAGPCFNQVHSDARLRHSDADFVSVIHTNTGLFGVNEPVGHKSYYPNGGSKQPNCMILGCSHVRAWALFAESVLNPHAFPAVKCRDWDMFKTGQCESEISYMGYPSTVAGSNGQYFLQTGGKHPYGLGLNGTKYKKTSLFW